MSDSIERLEDYIDFKSAEASLKGFENDLKSMSDTLARVRKLFQSDADKIGASLEKNLSGLNNLKATSSDFETLFKKISQENDKLIKSYESNKKAIKDLDKIQDNYNNSLGDQEQKLKDLKKVFKTLDPTLESDRSQFKKLAKELQQTNKNVKNLRDSARKANNVFEASEDSITALRKANTELTQELEGLPILADKTSVAFKQTEERAEELKKQIAENRTTINEFQEELKIFAGNVGNYPDILDRIEDSSLAAATGTQSLVGSFKALLANPVLLTLTAIVGALTALFQGFKRTAIGGDLLAKAGGFIDGVLSSLVGLVNKLTTLITPLFENPLESIKSFGQLIKENILNRFQAVIELGGLTAKALGQLFSGEFEKLKKTAVEATDSLNKLATGLDKEQQQNLIKSFVDLTKSIGDNIQAFTDLAEARRRVRRENRGLARDVEALITQEELLTKIADDTTKSFFERESAAERARNVLEKRAQTQVRLAKNNLDLVNAEVALRRQNGEEIEDLLDEQLQAYQEFQSAERDYTLSVRENEKQRSELRQDRLERDLDILIDGFDNQKTINERILADDSKTINERKKLLDQTVKLSQDSFDKQIETIRKFTKVQFDENHLLAEADAVVLNEKIRQLGLSEIIEGRLLEIIRDRRTAIQDLAEANRDLTNEEKERNRDLSIAQSKLQIERLNLEIQFGKEKIASLKERTAIEIQIEEKTRNFLLNQTGLSQKEKEQIIKESEERINKIRRDAAGEAAKINRNQLLKQLNDLSDYQQSSFSLFNSFSDRRTQSEDKRISDLNRSREIALEAAGHDAQERIRIEDSYDKEIEKIERKQRARRRALAIAEKAIAAFQSVINGLSAATAAVAPPPVGAGPIAGIPLAVKLKILAGLNTAAILAQPVPQFYDGIDDTGKGGTVDSRGGFNAVLHPKERVVDAKKQSRIKEAYGRTPTNDELVRDIVYFKTGAGIYDLLKAKTVDPSHQVSQQLQKAVQEQEERRQQQMRPQPIDYDKLSSAIASKIPASQTWVWNDDGSVEIWEKTGNVNRKIGTKKIEPHKEEIKRQKQINKKLGFRDRF